MQTSMGPIKIQLCPDKASGTVANFLTYVDQGFYDGTIFHRVISDFMIQGGGFTPDMQERTAHPPIPNEARDDLKNLRGTVAMARTPAIDSASSQFFINVKDNAFLDHADETSRGVGYCVFGKVVEGMDVVDRISSVATTRIGTKDDVPIEPVIIESVRRAE
ncbi:MAG: peptidyl-prolyl cis-trans isomerase [Phycisphaerae bacterium]|nr:peptidyl-prolyl cis-trans isomerase [Phycisphaerae bacterium]